MTESYAILMYAHLATVLPAVILGLLQFILKKGTPLHRGIGWTYMICMMITAILTLFMEARVGRQFLNHFGWIHLFSILTIWTVPTAIIAVRKGDIKSHKRKMVLLYVGAIVIAGAFTLTPGRYLHEVLFK